jgi:hypothetical protein
MRNLKRGISSEDSDNEEMRDDKIAEDYNDESGSVIEDDNNDLSSEEPPVRRNLNLRGRKRRAIY